MAPQRDSIFTRPRAGVLAVQKVRFAPDSPLEEPVSSELVSGGAKFPVSRENTGNFIESAHDSSSTAAKRNSESDG